MAMMNVAIALLLLASTVDAVSPPLTRGTLILESFYAGASRQTDWTLFAISPDGAATRIQSVSGKDGWRQIFLAPSADRIFQISYGDIHVSSDGWKTQQLFYRSREGTVEQMAPMGSGHYLAVQVSRPAASAMLVELDDEGAVVATHVLPSENPQEMPASWQIELLGDQCTVLHAARWSNDTEHRIRRYNLCMQHAVDDFTSIPLSFGEEITAIRQLPGGDVLVAAETGVRHYTKNGILLRMYPYPAHELALMPNACGFWIVEDDPTMHLPPRIRRIDFARPSAVPFEPEIGPSSGFNGFAVVGEWRAAVAKPKTRAVRH